MKIKLIKFGAIISLIIIASFLTTSKAFAETVSLTPSADASVESFSPDQNFGGSSYMKVEKSLVNNVMADSLVKFQLGAIPEYSTINSATLTLYIYSCASIPTDPRGILAGNVAVPWNEATTTWTLRPPIWGYYMGYPPDCVGNQPTSQSFNVKNLVQNWINRRWANYGFRLSNESSTSGFYITYYTRESNHQPKLEINYSPPGSGSAANNNAQNNANNNFSNQSGVSRGTGKSPGVNILADLRPPLELMARDWPQDWGGAIELFWVPSETADIDGYRVYRSSQENQGFEELYTTGNEETNIVDFQAETGKTFYYFVRAYRGDKESMSTNVVNVASRADRYDNIPQQRTTWAWWWKVILILFLAFIGLIILGVVIFVIIKIVKSRSVK
jgi:hypothetical protein